MNYLQKYLKYKFKYLTLKSNLEFAESNKLDSGKMKYLNLKNLMNFAVKNSTSSEKKSKDFLNEMRAGKQKYLKLKSINIPLLE